MGCYCETAKQRNLCAPHDSHDSHDSSDSSDSNDGNSQPPKPCNRGEADTRAESVLCEKQSDSDEHNRSHEINGEDIAVAIKDSHQQNRKKPPSPASRRISDEGTAPKERAVAPLVKAEANRHLGKPQKTSTLIGGAATVPHKPLKCSTDDVGVGGLAIDTERRHNSRRNRTAADAALGGYTVQLELEQERARISYRNATATARSMAATLASACSGGSGNVQAVLQHARHTLTAHLASASQALVENMGCYVAASAAADAAAGGSRHGAKRQPHCHQVKARGKKQQQSSVPAQSSPLPPPSPPQRHSTSYSCNATGTAVAVAAAFNYIGHNYYHLLRNSISFYMASSVILVLCYLTTTTQAATTGSSETVPFDKHPIQGIDWSKFDESSSDKEILDLLLEKTRYDKRLLPPVNDEDFCCGLSSPDMAKTQGTRRPHKRGTLTVNVNVLLLSLASPDESSLKYEVEFLLNQQWNDPRLQYGNKSQYDFLNALHHHDSIWTPDTYFIMHGDFKHPIIPMHFALRIYRNGTITYAMRRHLILSCQGSLHIFPFDDPKCSFSMESISYEEAQIKYVWKNDEDTLRKSPSLTTLNAYLIKNQTTACDQNSWRGNYSCLQVELTFTRDRAYYFTTVFIPGIILVTSSFITFWLEWNAVPARVMIGVTTMLNFFTTSNGFRSTLPVVSNLTAMNVWDGVCMCFIYASLLEFVCVNYVGRKRPLHNVVYRPGENPVTQRLPAVLSRIGVILASPLDVIEREFHAALSSEKAATGISSAGASLDMTPAMATPQPQPMSHMRWPHQQHQPQAQQQQAPQQRYGLIGAAVQNLRSRSVRRRPEFDPIESVPPTPTTSPPAALQQLSQSQPQPDGEPVVRTAPRAIAEEAIYDEPQYPVVSSVSAPLSPTGVQVVTLEDDDPSTSTSGAQALRRSRSMSTNTPPLVVRGENTRVDIHLLALPSSSSSTTSPPSQLPSAQANVMSAGGGSGGDIEMAERQQQPQKPPRRKPSRSTSPAAGGSYEALPLGYAAAAAEGDGRRVTIAENGEKRRDAGAPNEIVACTTCGGSNSPCTHSANNGCATDSCFVQMRKKEPPHPIRVAKTIDVIARITFPTAYAIFLIFFFVHYKGFS